ncbi:MAG TPA: iron dependent repressor, metal binding and dimerization domain protein [Nitrososphaeraceae archaeon]|nr:iron dependent repressor, metal binding and dimerization domain protein [Nitrososphaeraceae archaeon]
MMRSDSDGMSHASSTTPARRNRGSLYHGKGGLDARLTSIRDANRTMREERTDRMEDYLEVIYELVLQKGYATTIDISDYLNVSSPSVTRMMKKLHETGFIRYERYRGMSLTEKGVEVAKAIHKRHGILAEFFKMIGVQDDIANEDAEGIEHHLHSETLMKLEGFVRSMKRTY